MTGWTGQVGHVQQARPAPEHRVGRAVVVLLFLQSGCALVLSELSAGFAAVLYIPHLVELIELLLCLCSVVYQSWFLSRPGGVHNAA